MRKDRRCLQARGHIAFGDGGGEVMPSGRAFLKGIGLELGEAAHGRRVFCRPCLDWTERRHHIAGAVGTALCTHCLDRGWLQRTRDSRALTITADGEAAFVAIFGIDAASLGRSMARAAA